MDKSSDLCQKHKLTKDELLTCLRDFLGWTPIDTLLSEFASIAYHLDRYNAIDEKVLELYGEALTAAIAVEVKGALLKRIPDLPLAWFPAP